MTLPAPASNATATGTDACPASVYVVIISASEPCASRRYSGTQVELESPVSNLKAGVAAPAERTAKDDSTASALTPLAISCSERTRNFTAHFESLAACGRNGF